MHQNPFSQVNPIRSSDTTASTKPELNFQRISRPFMISRPRNLLIPNHQVSATAHWTNIQKQSYAVFACYFRLMFKDQAVCISKWNLFKGMSKFIKTRNPQQCRSHHLKLIKQFQDMGNFLSEAIKRIKNLKQKITEAEERLSQIQNQFDLYPISVKFGKTAEKQVYGRDYLSGYQANFQIFNNGQENLKQDFVKTADCYADQQNPVKFNNNNNGFSSSRSEFKPFGNIVPRSNRSSLPSFEQEADEAFPIKTEYKPIDMTHKISNFNSQISDQGFRIPIETTKSLIQKLPKIEPHPKDLYKMKQFMQCHYLFQLWTSKLQKIIRQTSTQGQKNQQQN